MAGSVNKVILVGNLGQDPEIRTFENGNEVANISVATSETWRDKTTGERRERTEWHRVAIFNPSIVSIARQFLKKGAKVYVEGQLETRKWQDQNGQDRYQTEVVLRPYRGELTMLDGRGQGNDQGGYARDDRAEDQGRARNDNRQATKPQAAPAYNDIEDEIPF